MFPFTLILLMRLSLLGQILNPGFESWTFGVPDNWQVDNGGGMVPVTRSIIAHSDSFSVKGASVLPPSSSHAWPPVIVSGSDGEGFPISYRPTSLNGFYIYSPGPYRDTFYVRVTLTAYDTVSGEDMVIGYGFFRTNATTSSWADFSANIDYSSDAVPEVAHIRAEIGVNLNVGQSYFYLDDLSFTPVVGVQDPEENLPSKYALSQNFPNPFNPNTTIRFSLPQSNYVTMKVFNVLGEEVASLVSQVLLAGAHTADWNAGKMESGIYFYRIRAGAFSDVKKMLYLK